MISFISGCSILIGILSGIFGIIDFLKEEPYTRIYYYNCEIHYENCIIENK